MGDEYVPQPDGRLVAGPQPIPATEKKARSSLPLLAAAWGATTLAAFAFGYLVHTPTGDFHSIVRETLIAQACVPQSLVVPVTKDQTAGLLDQIEAYVQQLVTSQRAENVRTELVDIPDSSPLRKAVPAAEALGIATWEACL